MGLLPAVAAEPQVWPSLCPSLGGGHCPVAVRDGSPLNERVEQCGDSGRRG